MWRAGAPTLRLLGVCRGAPRVSTHELFCTISSQQQGALRPARSPYLHRRPTETSTSSGDSSSSNSIGRCSGIPEQAVPVAATASSFAVPPPPPPPPSFSTTPVTAEPPRTIAGQQQPTVMASGTAARADHVGVAAQSMVAISGAGSADPAPSPQQPAEEPAQSEWMVPPPPPLGAQPPEGARRQLPAGFASIAMEAAASTAATYSAQLPAESEWTTPISPLPTQSSAGAADRSIPIPPPTPGPPPSAAQTEPQMAAVPGPLPSIPNPPSIPGPPPSAAQTEPPMAAVAGELPSIPDPPSIPGPPPSAGIPAPPVTPTQPTPVASSAEGAADVATRRVPEDGTLTPEQQYERLKPFLPLTKAPNTAIPKPEELKVGTRLRVEWSDTWWAARVKAEDESRVRIGFDTWSTHHDEWVPRDSPRLRFALPEDPDLEAESQATQVQDFGPPKTLVPARAKPFVPKPYNPEREFQKRQMRLKEKIAAMQRSKLGDVDPALSFLNNSEETAVATASEASFSAANKSGDIPPPPPLAAPATDQASLSRANEADIIPPPPLSTPATGIDQASPASPAIPAVLATPAALEQAAAVPAAKASVPAVAMATTAAAASWTSTAEAASTAALETAPEQTAATNASAATAAAEQKVDMPAVFAGGAVAGTSALLPSAVQWEECLTEQKERYYHELSTGRTAWELPHDGWVQLLADDGAPYYWNATTGVTQWVAPTAPPSRL